MAVPKSWVTLLNESRLELYRRRGLALRSLPERPEAASSGTVERKSQKAAVGLAAKRKAIIKTSLENICKRRQHESERRRQEAHVLLRFETTALRKKCCPDGSGCWVIEEPRKCNFG